MSRIQALTTANATPLSQPAPSFTQKAPTVDHWADPLDISDVWNIDIESDGDAEVFAYFNTDGCTTLAGLSYNDGHGVIYCGPETAMGLMGKAAVIRFEKAYAEGSL